jgi:hypothetical protein
MGSKHVEGSKIKNGNINLEIVHCVGLYCILQSTVQKTLKNGLIHQVNYCCLSKMLYRWGIVKSVNKHLIVCALCFRL